MNAYKRKMARQSVVYPADLTEPDQKTLEVEAFFVKENFRACRDTAYHALLNNRQDFSFLDRLTFFDQNGFDDAGKRGFEGDFHFHRFENNHFVAAGHAFANLFFNLENRTRDVGRSPPRQYLWRY